MSTLGEGKVSGQWLTLALLLSQTLERFLIDKSLSDHIAY